MSALTALLRNQIAARSSDAAINATWLIFDRIVRLAVGVFVGAWLARYLGPGRYGELIYAISFVAVFQTIAALGLDGIVVRDLARRSTDCGRLLGSVALLRFIAGLVSVIIAVTAVAVMKDGESEVSTLVVIISACLPFQSADAIDLWFQSEGQNRRSVAARLTSYLVVNALKALLIGTGAPLIAFAWITLLEFVLASVVLALIYRNHPTPTPWRPTTVHVARALKESWPYLISALAIYCYLRLDLLIIGHLLDETSVGIYAAASTLANLWHFVPAAMGTALGPQLARRSNEAPGEYNRMLRQISLVGGFSSMVCSGALALLAHPLVALLYGQAYAPAASLLAIKAFCNVPVFFGVFQTILIVNRGNGHLMLVRTLVAAVCAIALNLLLIPRSGLIGAAWASLCSFLVADVFAVLLVSPRLFLEQFGFGEQT